MMMIAVVGAGSCSKKEYGEAYEIGRLIAKSGATLVTGGLSGIMEAASNGAHDEGGLVVGIIPGADKTDANRYVAVPIVTGAGHMRNMIIANTADAVIAVYGSYGTLSEVAISLKIGKKVIGYNSWEIKGVITANTPEEAVKLAINKENTA
jgi:uncharacterized protein (TIGR00725 family)